MAADTDMMDQPTGLFSNCSFAIVRGVGKNNIPEAEILNLCETIRLHAGQYIVDAYPEGQFELKNITHIISNTSDFPDYDRVVDHMIPVVRPMWVENSLAKDKLVNTRQYNPDPRMFMSDVVACCADNLPEGDAEAIAGGILAMGGLYSAKLTVQITHIVALSVEAEICQIAQRRHLPAKIVLPHWFDDCLRLSRKIDEQPYLLPDPVLFLAPKNVAPRGANNTKITGATNPDPSLSPPLTPENGQVPRHVFKQKSVMLSSDLGIGSHLRDILDGVIRRCGGTIPTTVESANIFICKYRSGSDYRAASLADKDVGNLAWLYYLITNDTWTSPMRRLLHYPTVRRGIPGFEQFKISLSNYNGEARTYLENLIVASGAECTKTLKQDNTHLITAHSLSEKCAAARDWNIHLVNHLWLEESYAKWQLQSVANTRYTHFPQQTNLGEIVGMTPIDKSVLKRIFFNADDGHDATDDTEMTDVPNVPPPNQQVNQHANDPVGADRRSTSPIRVVKNPTEGKPKPLANPAVRIQTPVSNRGVGVGKENITPSTTGSRRSKEAATARIHSMTPDIALYEKERKRVGGVVYGGKRAKIEEPAPTRKRSVDEASEDEESDEKDAKKARRNAPPTGMHLLISRYQKWIGHSKIEDSDKRHLRSLGILVTTDPARASHLAAPHILRTAKFVTALAFAPIIISTKYIDDCLAQNEALDPDEYLLNDKVSEKKLALSLSLSRERAKENKQQLLQGRTVYCLENIHGGFDTYKMIVEANGGQCIPFRNRKGQMVASTRAGSDANADDDSLHEVYLLSEPDSKDDNRAWVRFREMAEGARKTPRVVSTDWLIQSAMCQKIQDVGKYELGKT